MRGWLEEAEKHLMKGIGFCEKLNEKNWNSTAHFYLGEIYSAMGDFTRSKDYYEKGGRLLEIERLRPSFAGLGRIGVARSRVMNNEKEVDLESLYAF